MNIAAATAVQVLMLALAVLLALAFVVGAVVALRPRTLELLRGGADRRVSMRRATRLLDVPYNIDRWFYRYHRIYGAAVALLAVVLLGFLTFGGTYYQWLQLFDPRYRDIAEIVAVAARALLWGFGLFALAIAAIVFARPSALKGFEAWANRWITPRRPFRALDREVGAPDRWVARHPRGWGIAIAAISGACLVALLLHAGMLARLGG